ncbi:hypothetical protein H6P81_000280 [Aristolochia fimbriata]|uniref:C2 NT-type domain-containing protein n=1 Tax=Aristolochia fimbriata TaxID=158543 RepID=A0AAV7F6Z9_ARIFI|nr:hypothetical protein H6P81_000280 [Aristolochia fimbriata]
MLKWSPWPGLASETKRFQVKVKVLRVEGLREGNGGKVAVVEMRWKGPAKTSRRLVSLRKRDGRRNVSETKGVDGEVVEFGDEFENVCGFQVLHKDQSFIAWDLAISLLYGDAEEDGNKLSVIGSVSLNLAEAAWELQRENETLSQLEKKLPVPLKLSGAASDALLYISMSFVEMRTSQEASQTIQDDGFLRRMTSYVSSSRRAKKKNKIPAEEMEIPADKKLSGRLAGEADESWSFDTDSPDEESGGARAEELGYSSITSAVNHVVDSPGDDSSVYYGYCVNSDKGTNSTSESNLMGGLLSWRKRKLSFRTGKRKEEPLLKKGNDEGGGDDIDFARRELESSSKPMSLGKWKDDSENSGPLNPNIKVEEEFKTDAWEEKEIISRDGQAKIRSLISFASIDQRSESASGESACAVLVAFISDWVHNNLGSLPTRSQFDTLIKEGSREWQKLCENEVFLERFPDKHFDMETVLEERIRSITIAPEKSFIGFFNPDRFEFLEGAMSFDAIWDEISAKANNGEEQVYIVSWNDHFFLLKVDPDAFYIIDTLGERLFEGCQLAYILRFDDTTSMYNSSGERGKDRVSGEERKKEDEEGLLCKGKHCCKEYIKRFLAAIPLRDLEEEKQKGNTHFPHHKLQIEFHFTQPSSSGSSSDEWSQSPDTNKSDL